MVGAYMVRDESYEGVFFTGVRTTGIFCRPTCTARKPKPENVEFFATARDALFSGYRACKRCRPMEQAGSPPEWLRPLLAAVEDDPTRRWRDADICELDLTPERVRRWFQQHHGMTFHAYVRARRLGSAFTKIRDGGAVTNAAFGHGYESLSGFNESFKKLIGKAPTGAKTDAVITLRRIVTPLGPMVAGAIDDGVCLLEFADRRMLEKQIDRLRAKLKAVFVPGTNEVLDTLSDELAAYFEGSLRRFEVPTHAPGSEFQERVWKELGAIPFGTTTSYGELARAIGRPTASRAVARANGDNRIAILIPCHRVIGADGALSGYGGGVWRKKRLLEIERGR
jgi:AraC family transcriptional regulator of adaptative response/methylated-DNA-[protein]-cysteine methyltransferase